MCSSYYFSLKIFIIFLKFYWCVEVLGCTHRVNKFKVIFEYRDNLDTKTKQNTQQYRHKGKTKATCTSTKNLGETRVFYPETFDCDFCTCNPKSPYQNTIYWMGHSHWTN